ncbi:unnamed protein product [Lactuca virosa]|uniref:DUF4408 domain-containing protein n=1 Tax=Lactuca virosa TaxID=75947 RepID=A0AAU9MZS3_9ASTR|nr:unnamed protein product [Lactuca virosa]
MVGDTESMAIASMWASMSSWCSPTPTMLFCIMNLIIATIFIASKTNNTKHHDHVQWNSFGPIGRVSSFLERSARSVNLSSYTTTITTTVAESQHQCPSPSKTAKYSSSSRLAQSIHFPSGDETRSPLRSSISSPPEFSNAGDEMSQSESERQPRSQNVRAPSLLERVKSVNFSSVYSDNTVQTESKQICNSPAQLARPPSFFDRIKSFKISSAFKLGAPSTQPENLETEPAHNPDHHVIKNKSEKTSAKKPPVEMKKSRSEIMISSDDDEDVDVRRPETARVMRNADDKEFDLKADDFISRFKQQLKLQRVESLVRFRDMLNRGT